MRTIVLLAVTMLSVPCFAQKVNALQACQDGMGSMLHDALMVIDENDELKLKIKDLEEQLEKSQTMAKFWANFAAEGLRTPAPAPMPMPYPVYIDPIAPNVTVQPRIVIDRNPVEPFPPAPVIQDKQIFCTTQTYGNTEYTSCN